MVKYSWENQGADIYLKPGITEKIEGEQSYSNTIKLFEDKKFINSLLKLSLKNQLIAIHGKIFKDLHLEIGKFRKVNISKDGFIFSQWNYIEKSLGDLENYDKKSIDNILETYVELNIVHPFREGNGRSLRVWLDVILSFYHNVMVNWSNISYREYMNKMIISPYNSSLIKKTIMNNLINKIDGVKVFNNNLKHSYLYEKIEIE